MTSTLGARQLIRSGEVMKLVICLRQGEKVQKSSVRRLPHASELVLVEEEPMESEDCKVPSAKPFDHMAQISWKGLCDELVYLALDFVAHFLDSLGSQWIVNELRLEPSDPRVHEFSMLDEFCLSLRANCIDLFHESPPGSIVLICVVPFSIDVARLQNVIQLGVKLRRLLLSGVCDRVARTNSHKIGADLVDDRRGVSSELCHDSDRALPSR